MSEESSISNISSVLTIDKVLASTRSADLFQATDSRTNEEVLLWTMRHIVSKNDDSVKRFNARINTIKKIKGVHKVIASGVDDSGVAYVIMPSINAAPLDETEVEEEKKEIIFQGICKIIHSVHKSGLICGDLTTDSFWIGKRGKVNFLGILGSFDVEADSTSAAPPKETFHFLSPEQRTGESLEASSDIYALGVICYKFFTGKFPSEQANKNIMLGCPETDHITPIKVLNPNSPDWTSNIIANCLNLKKSERITNTEDLIALANNQFVEGFDDMPVGRRIEDNTPSAIQGIVGKVSLKLKNNAANIGNSAQGSDIEMASDKSFLEKIFTFSLSEYLGQQDKNTLHKNILVMGAVLALICCVGAVASFYIIFFDSSGDSQTDLSSKIAKNVLNTVTNAGSQGELNIGTIKDGIITKIEDNKDSQGSLTGANQLHPEFTTKSELSNYLATSDVKENINKVLNSISKVNSESIMGVLINAVDERKKVSSDDLTEESRVITKKIEKTLVRVLKKNFSKKLVKNVDKIIAKGDLDKNFSASVSSLDPSIPVEDRANLLRTNYNNNPEGSIKLASLLAREPAHSRVWENVVTELITDSLKLDNTRKYSVSSLIAIHPASASTLDDKSFNSLLDELSDEELIWVLNNNPIEQGTSNHIKIANKVLQRDIMKEPHKTIIEVVAKEEHIPGSVLKELIKTVHANNVTVETINQINSWNNIAASKVLLAACSMANSDKTIFRAVDVILTRSIDPGLLSNTIKWLRSQYRKDAVKYSNIICNSPFYSNLEEKRKKELLFNINTHIDNTQFLKLLISDVSNRLVLDIVEQSGQNLGITVLTDLLRFRDKRVRIKALEHLKWYSDVGVLGKVMKLYHLETDPDVKKVYKDNFWSIQQSEALN